MKLSGDKYKTMFSPILLQSKILGVANQVSATAADESQLRNRLNTPMLLDEIRIMGGSILSGAYDQYLQLELGRTQLTNGPVPIGLLGLQLDPTTLWGSNVSIEPDKAPWTWKLPKPLYIPAGEYLRPTITYDALSDISQSLDFYISYVGRSLPKNFPKPRSIQVPWACAFKTDRRTSDGTYLSESTEVDLCNPFDVPLSVQRFMGAIDLPFGGAPTANLHDLTKVRASDSAGKILIRDPTDMDILFIGNGHAWTVNSVLPPKGFYKLAIEQEYASAGLSGFTVRSVITMIGYREVSL